MSLMTSIGDRWSIVWFSFTSETEVSVSEVCWTLMPVSTPVLPDDRLAVGQILIRLLNHFREQLYTQPDREERFPGLRFAHMPIWGNVGIDGVRLTDLAQRANLSLPACSELVNDLQDLGYLERRPDPLDGRAKLIHPTKQGRALLARAGQAVAEIEAEWRQKCRPGSFDQSLRTLDRLLATLDASAAD
jgi:DNA-binding MarR family transcriptional regulator